MAEAERRERSAAVRFDDERMYVLLRDGREIAKWEFLPFGDVLHWPGIDEDLDVHGFLIGARAPDAKPPIAT